MPTRQPRDRPPAAQKPRLQLDCFALKTGKYAKGYKLGLPAEFEQVMVPFKCKEEGIDLFQTCDAPKQKLWKVLNFLGLHCLTPGCRAGLNLSKVPIKDRGVKCMMQPWANACMPTKVSHPAGSPLHYRKLQGYTRVCLGHRFEQKSRPARGYQRVPVYIDAHVLVAAARWGMPKEMEVDWNWDNPQALHKPCCQKRQAGYCLNPLHIQWARPGVNRQDQVLKEGLKLLNLWWHQLS